MTESDVRIVKLEPMRVASVRAISETPERDAWEKVRTWAEPKGLLADIEKHPIFGFNNPLRLRTARSTATSSGFVLISPSNPTARSK